MGISLSEQTSEANTDTHTFFIFLPCFQLECYIFYDENTIEKDWKLEIEGSDIEGPDNTNRQIIQTKKKNNSQRPTQTSKLHAPDFEQTQTAFVRVEQTLYSSTIHLPGQ